MRSLRYFKEHKECISRERNASVNNKCTSRVTKYPRMVSSWSLDDSRSLIGTDDVPPLVVLPRARWQFPRIDISGSESSSEHKVDVSGARCSRQEQQDAIFYLNRVISGVLSPSRALPALRDWTTEGQSSYDHRTVSISAISVLVASSSGILWQANAYFR